MGRDAILLVEPFYAGSHARLIDLLASGFDPGRVRLVTMPGKKWPWRARTSALWLAETVTEDVAADVKTLFASSVLNLAELVALRPDIRDIPRKILYFHENQLVYPVRKTENQQRDFQYGYNQILSSIVADEVLFNSHYNMNSFLDGIDGFLRLMPDHRPKNLKDKIILKCSVLYFPINCLPTMINCNRTRENKDGPLQILWPHRWEHDKNPDLFFRVIFRLKEEGLSFRLSVLGEQYTQIPEIFETAKSQLNDQVSTWGFVESSSEYQNELKNADVVVSTADHEFFGVAMMEAIRLGCYPLAPNRLVYPELYPTQHLYNTENQLFKLLKRFCHDPTVVRRSDVRVDTDRFTWNALRNAYIEKLDWMHCT